AAGECAERAVRLTAEMDRAHLGRLASLRSVAGEWRSGLDAATACLQTVARRRNGGSPAETLELEAAAGSALAAALAAADRALEIQEAADHLRPAQQASIDAVEHLKGRIRSHQAL